ncbi:glycosyltransferase family A protein [Mucilaginibacter sp.]|jgi:glycosyltransferase involved in cell wall biosynthesis|uniref:glycosyltransferase family 2 protein n=1 Tax=Mucilaginibacter sp. TaxID=1882438 RepID=UPI002BD2FFDE|nr:glycosyltransferase family A protein [Mucilaginibacter sp.]HTI60214.1 glycosyltransferase family A protein [Mucilaginibacter sp.]
MHDDLPKISCLTVTANRLILLKQAVACFMAQTYPNKELVVVTDGTAYYKRCLADYVHSLRRSDIKFVFLDEADHPLGKLRNISIENASGDVICQWDDDDLYHSDRLQIQYDHMKKENAGACFLGDQLHYFAQRGEIFWVDWIASNTIHERDQLFPGSMMAYKDDRFRYPEDGHYARTGEDTDYLYQLYQHIKVTRLRHRGYIYVYRYHGQNAFNLAHHDLIASTHACSFEFARANEAVLRKALKQYQLPMPYIFKVRDNRSFFTYNE